MKRIFLILALVAAPAAFASSTTTTTFGVGATVPKSCAVKVYSGMGVIYPSWFYAGHTKTNSSGTKIWTGGPVLEVACTNGTSYQLGLGPGTNASSISSRQMADGSGDFLNYSIHHGSATGPVWGNTPGTNTFGTTPINGNWTEYYVYVVVPEQDTVPPGAYTDTVIATVYY